MKHILYVLVAGLLWFTPSAWAQTGTPDPFDFGKMWTFENPPVEWFDKAYDFAPPQEWFDQVRLSSLRFASWCSASFVSPDGLIMTNHHCARVAITSAQNEGENFDRDGYYAPTLADERKANGLYVEQMVMARDVTDELLDLLNDPVNEQDKAQQLQAAIKTIEAQYAADELWKGLRLQTVSFYSGVKYSLYGYKRFDDVRLVFYPELDLGLFGGDPDNFTYPRYNLDVSFWRAYDEEGNPVNSSAHYFPFNTDGVTEGEPTFVVGNPGSTERYRTVAQLEYDRDYRYPMLLRYLKNRYAFLMEEFETLSKDPSKALEAQQKNSEAFSVSNSIKANEGVLGGLENPDLFGRKVTMEKYIRSLSPGLTHWDDIASIHQDLIPHTWAVTHLRSISLRGKALAAMFQLYNFEHAIEEEVTEAELQKSRTTIEKTLSEMDSPRERRLLQLLLTEIQADIYPGDPTLEQVLQGKSIEAFVSELFKSTVFTDAKKTSKLLVKPSKLAASNDILLTTARVLAPRYLDAALAFSSTAARRKELEGQVARQAFRVFGDDLPPDATFTLRLADGVVKGFNYNGTEAPFKTTFFGLYDRYYSNDRQSPWSLPDKWANPPMELLSAPLNFVSTNDIIGGNSGSPMINKNLEAVGLIFDSNIQSLPSRFIFAAEEGRTVSVHAGGITAALKYIYGADRLVTELGGQR